MRREYKEKLYQLFRDYGIEIDADYEKIIDRIIKAWQEKHPVKVTELPEGGGARLTVAIENFKDSKNITDIQSIIIYRADLTETGINITHRQVASDTALVYSAISEGSHFENLEYNVRPANFINQKNSQKNVFTLCNSIASFLEMSGLIGNRHITGYAQFQSELAKVLGPVEKERHLSAFRNFGKNISPEIMKTMRAVNMDDVEAVNWFYAQGDRQKQKYRLQAAQTYTLFMPLILNYSFQIPEIANGLQSRGTSPTEKLATKHKDLRIKDTIKKISTNIDQGLPVTDLLCDCLGRLGDISPRTIKNLSRIKRIPRKMSYRTFLESLSLLDQLDSNQHPKNGRELKDFIECSERAEIFSEISGHPVIEHLKKAKGRWAEWKEKTVSSQAVRDIKDWKSEIFHTLIMAGIVGQLPDESLTVIRDERTVNKRLKSTTWGKEGIYSDKNPYITSFFSGISEKEMLACSLRWHEQMETYSARKEALRFMREPEKLTWSPLSKSLVSPGGLRIKPLTSKAELVEEGRAMGNCVGNSSYDLKCMTEKDHILSISENGGGKRLAPVQLREVFNKKIEVSGLEIVQIQGPGANSARRAVEWYITELFNNPARKPHWRKIEEERSENRIAATRKDFALWAGYDPLPEENRRKMFYIIQPYLPERYRHYSYEDFTELPQIKEMLKPKNATLGQKLIEAGYPVSKEPEFPEPEPRVKNPSNDNCRFRRIFRSLLANTP
jgi:hypothetical protein